MFFDPAWQYIPIGGFNELAPLGGQVTRGFYSFAVNPLSRMTTSHVEEQRLRMKQAGYCLYSKDMNA